MRLQVQLQCKHFLQTSEECDVLLRERVRIRTTMAHTLHGMHYPLTQHATAATLQVLSATKGMAISSSSLSVAPHTLSIHGTRAPRLKRFTLLDTHSDFRFFLVARRPPRSTPLYSSAASRSPTAARIPPGPA